MKGAVFMDARMQKASDEDDLARWDMREKLVEAMLEAVAANAHVRRQLRRLGLKRSMDETLFDLLSRTELGARFVDRISVVERDDKYIDKVFLLVQQGLSAKAAMEKVARWTVRHIADDEDTSFVVVRKAIERGVRLAAKAGEIEEVIAVGFKSSPDVELLVTESVARELIGVPIRTQKLRDTLVAFTPTAKMAGGRQFAMIFRRPFIGPSGAVSTLIRNSVNPWQELTQLHTSRDEIRTIAREKITPLSPTRRKGRGSTMSKYIAIPVNEVRRIARELALQIGRPVDRSRFFAGLYATLTECNVDTLARINDPTNPFATARNRDAHRTKATTESHS